jgi:hypothetical protein
MAPTTRMTRPRMEVKLSAMKVPSLSGATGV